MILVPVSSLMIGIKSWVNKYHEINTALNPELNGPLESDFILEDSFYSECNISGNLLQTESCIWLIQRNFMKF